MSKAGLIFTGGCAILALFFLVPALSFPGTTKEGTPGPGYFPIIVCSIILLLCLTLAVSYLRRKEEFFQKNETERSNLPTLLITCAAVVAYPVLFMFLPFIPLTIVYMIFLNWVYKRPWLFNIIFSIVFTVAMYYLFGKFLHIML